MKKSEMKELLRSSIEPQRLCRVYFKYDENYYYYFPFQTSDKLFLGAEEDDFIIDGFSIRRFCDVTKVEIKNDKCIDIIKAEGILDGVSPPKLDISNWYTAFLSLKELGKNIIVRRESLDEDECAFAIGRIEKVLKHGVVFSHFDAEGIWHESLYEIPYSQITSVTFSSRYVDVFSKCV